MNIKTVFLILFFSVASTNHLLFSDSAAPTIEKTDPYKIVKCADDLMRGETLQGKMEMTVVRSKWTRHRYFNSWNVGYDKAYVRITNPEIEKGTGSLRIGFNFWNYVAKAERTIKLSPSLMLQPWIGSDFTNDDLVKMSSISRDYHHEIVGEEERQGYKAYKIKLTPRPEAPVVWGGVMVWIDQAGCIPLRVEYYDEEWVLVRTLDYSEIRQVDDRVIPTVMTMQFVNKPGNKTILKTLEAKYNRPIPSDIFTLENLEGRGEEFR